MRRHIYTVLSLYPWWGGASIPFPIQTIVRGFNALLPIRETLSLVTTGQNIKYAYDGAGATPLEAAIALNREPTRFHAFHKNLNDIRYDWCRW